MTVHPRLSKFVNAVAMPNIAALAFLFASIDLTLQLTHHIAPEAVFNDKIKFWQSLFTTEATIALGLAIFCGAWTLFAMDPPAQLVGAEERKKASDKLFTRYLIGIGYFLLVLALVSMIAIAGLAAKGLLDGVLGEFGSAVTGVTAPDETKKAALNGMALLASLTMTLLGALFYFANSLWKKFRDPEIFFEENIFWAGLWFRLAEAIVLTIAVFLFLHHQKSSWVAYLPMIALFIGMTVKSSEALIFGIIEKTLAAVSGLVDSGKKETRGLTNRPGNRTANPAANGAQNGGISMRPPAEEDSPAKRD